MPFRGLTMLKSPKLTIKGGLCYVFAMVFSDHYEYIDVKIEELLCFPFPILKSIFQYCRLLLSMKMM